MARRRARFTACLIDIVVVSVATGVLCRWVWPWLDFLPVYFPLGVAYRVVMQARFGGTLGKLLMRLRVVSWPSLSRVGWRQVFVRESLEVGWYSVLLALAIAGRLVGSAWIETTYLDSSGSRVERVETTISHAWLVVTLISSFVAIGIYKMADSLAILGGTKRTIHDRIAGTAVVSADEVASPSTTGPVVVNLTTD